MLKQLLKMGLATSLGWRAAARLRRRGLVALMYHRINAGKAIFPGLPLASFRSQMAWVKKNCTPIRPESILDAARHADRLRPPVIVTFDDGYRDYFDYAYPVLRELGIPAMVFLSTDCIDRGRVIWTEALHWAALMTRKPSAGLPWRSDKSLPLGCTAQRLRFVEECKAYLKSAPDDLRRSCVATILKELDVPAPEDRLGRQMLDWDEVRASRAGTSFGGHSHTHPILSQLQPADMEREIRVCRDRIAAETGSAPDCFAYPNGRATDFNDLTKDLLRRHGFALAFSTAEGINGPDADPLALHRIPTGARTIGDFAALVEKA